MLRESCLTSGKAKPAHSLAECEGFGNNVLDDHGQPWLLGRRQVAKSRAESPRWTLAEFLDQIRNEGPAAPLPVLGPGGPALRVGLPPDDVVIVVSSGAGYARDDQACCAGSVPCFSSSR